MDADAAFAEAQRWVESPITSPDLPPPVVNALVATIERQGRQLDAARARLGDAVAELSAIRQDLDVARTTIAEQAAEIERLRELATRWHAHAVKLEDTAIGGLTCGSGNNPDSLADDLAQAWLVISRAEEGDGRTNRSFPDELPAYVEDDWSKMAARRLNGYARLHRRPVTWPWQAREFDQFEWDAALDAAPARKD